LLAAAFQAASGAIVEDFTAAHAALIPFHWSQHVHKKITPSTQSLPGISQKLAPDFPAISAKTESEDAK
jgi:hypothetical protein